MAEAAQTFKLEFPYRRSLGPVVGEFLTGLREGRVLGSRTPSGSVLVPPLEYDPETGDGVDGDLVEVGTAGVVTGWSWVEQPIAKHPFDRPFAWALVRLDGATSSLLHALDAGSMDQVRTGMRVAIRWRDERKGHITDIECFEPAGPERPSERKAGV